MFMVYSLIGKKRMKRGQDSMTITVKICIYLDKY